MKQNFTSLAVKAKQKCGSGTSHLGEWWKNGRRTSVLWQSRQSSSAEAELHILWNAEVDLPIFGSPNRTSAENEWDVPKSWPMGSTEKELQIFVSKERAELRKRSFRPLKVLAERECRSWTSDRWQPRQDGSAEAERHILRRIGRAEVRNEFHVTSLVVRPNGSAGGEVKIFGSSVKLEV